MNVNPYQNPYNQPMQLQNQRFSYINNNQMNFLKGFSVSSIDEVKATRIDLDGSIFYFPNLDNQTIYTKQINIDGTATIKTFCFQEPKKEKEVTFAPEKYVTKEQLEEALENIKQEFKEKKNKREA